jgi:hypothetical protein
MGPDGALYISDDSHGRIWRVTYHGDPNVQVTAAPSPKVVATTSGEPGPPEGIHPEAGRLASLPVPPGASPDQVALGGRIFNGEAAGGTCQPSSSRLDNSVKMVSGGNRSRYPAFSAKAISSFCLLGRATSIVTSLGERNSLMFMSLQSVGKIFGFNRERTSGSRFLSRCECI